MNKSILSSCVISLLFGMLFCVQEAAGQYAGWKHSGRMYIVTTPEGADLPATAVEKDFPLLVRLHSDFFDFDQARPGGEDIRFSQSGKPLSYQVEQWDSANGKAVIWVRVPTIRGNAQQAIRMHWGHDLAASESDGEKVFRVSEGFAGVWHLGDVLEDATSNNLDAFRRPDLPATPTKGIAGGAQEFGVNKLLVVRQPNSRQDRRVTCMPAGNADRTMSAWVYPTSFEGRNWASASIGGWGEPERGQKPNMGLSYMTLTGTGQHRFHLYGFDPRCEKKLPLGEWHHIGLSVSEDRVRFYLDGVLQRTIDNNRREVERLGTLRTPRLTPVDLGDHGNGRGPFNGSLDEVRFESIARSAHWLKLCFENQKPLQSLVGPLVVDGDTFSISKTGLTLDEGDSVLLTAKAGGARKIYWVLKDGTNEKVLAVDRFQYRLEAGRVDEDRAVELQVRALFEAGMKTRTIRVGIREKIPNPAFSLPVPATWNGRDELVIAPRVKNLAELKARAAGKLNATWKVSGMATIQKLDGQKLILKRAQNSGELAIVLALDNGGKAVVQSAKIRVVEPGQDRRVLRKADDRERPVDHQFFARDELGLGTVHCNGVLEEPADSAFFKLFVGEKLIDTQRQKVAADRKYTLSVRLQSGLVAYRTEFGFMRDGVETVLEKADDLVCGDVFVIQGQSNAEAWTDKRVVHPYRSRWLRSFGTPSTNKDRARDAVWGNALSFNGGENHHHFQIGYWGVELGKLLIEKHQVPICILNGAQGGTRIDQHQRNELDPTDVETIYGRLLWRLQQARLTHGVRAVLWHQGENDQGAAGPTGTYGWVNYENYFIRMAASWKEDYPNIEHYYIHQIWPGACGGRSVESDRLRERQRRLPNQFSNMSLLSTLGIRPGGGCHYLPEGYAMLARQQFPLLNRNHYGIDSNESLVSPNLESVSYTNGRRDEIRLVFDQEVEWEEEVARQFLLDGEGADLSVVAGRGKVVLLKLSGSSSAKTLSYVQSGKWREEDAIIRGTNQLAALTFCEVGIREATSR